MKKLMTTIYLSALLLGPMACSDDETMTEIPGPGNYTTATALLESQNFQGSVLIQKQGEDIIRQGYGMADVASGIANDVNKVYRIGSMTKAFTAAGIVHLKRDGLIDSFDQPISVFSDDFPYGDQITLRHLLRHESGIPDYTSAIEQAANQQNMSFTPDDILDVIAEAVDEDGLLFEPGVGFMYSNSNYLMLALLIEELADVSYHDYLQQKIFTPLGMSNTGVGTDEIEGQGFAKGYEDGVEVAPYQMSIAFGAGDLVSTIADIELWGKAIMDDYFTNEEKAQLFEAPYPEDDVNAVGFGWFTIKNNGVVMYHHGGDIDGFTSFIGLLPDSKGLIILLSNEQDRGEQRNLITDTIVENEF